VKCISYLFDGLNCLQKGILLSKGVTRSITEDGTRNTLFEKMLTSSMKCYMCNPLLSSPSASNDTREAKISLLSCTNASSDPKLQELGVHLHLGKDFLLFQERDYSILLTARKQLFSLPTARSLYVRAITQLLSEIKSKCEDHLQTISVQSKFADSAELETSCRTWNRLLFSLHPGQLSFLPSDTLPTAINL